jgi:hypothetical protein
MKFDYDQLTTISNALFVAKERFQENVSDLQKNYGSNPPEGIKRLVEQFAMQQDKVQKLYDQISVETGIQC